MNNRIWCNFYCLYWLSSAKMSSASGGEAPLTPRPGALPLDPTGALPPDPHYRLTLPRSPWVGPPQLSKRGCAPGRNTRSELVTSKKDWALCSSVWTDRLHGVVVLTDVKPIQHKCCILCCSVHNYLSNCVQCSILQTMSGLRLMVTFLKRVYEHDEVAQVFIYRKWTRDCCHSCR